MNQVGYNDEWLFIKKSEVIVHSSLEKALYLPNIVIGSTGTVRRVTIVNE